MANELPTLSLLKWALNAEHLKSNQFIKEFRQLGSGINEEPLTEADHGLLKDLESAILRGTMHEFQKIISVSLRSRCI